MKTTFIKLMNRYEILQRSLVDLVLDGPEFIANYAERILSHSERGRGLLNDQKIYRELTDHIRVTSAVRKLQEAGFSCTVDRQEGYCIWLRSHNIDFVWDTMNDEPDYHPRWITTNERNIDALVDRREIDYYIFQNK